VLFLGTLSFEEDGFVIADAMTDVGNNGVVMWIRMRFHNSSKVGKTLVGCPIVGHSVHGGGMCGHGGRVGSFHGPRWLETLPPL
jgi:hypothetical protein